MAKEYVDRERLKEAFSTDAQHSLSYFSDSLFELLLLEIDEVPAADVAPVVPGRWDVGGVCPWNGVVGNWKCSACGGVSLKKTAYCPNCGAKMDLEVDHA